MLIPKEWSFATPVDLGGSGNYRRFCKAADLHPVPDGWGLLHCEDEHGKRWTAVTGDVEYLRLFVTGDSAGLLADLEVPAEKFPNRREGWPDDWA